jgi:exodeoxyribonuclease VII large subunit
MESNSSTLTLLELNSLVRHVIERTLNGEYWVEADLSECRESRGHCYMEMVQKDPRSAVPVARASVKCWHSQWALLKPYFERITGQQLHAGMKVRMKVYAQFHEAYGFSWIVTDIDPAFTLGDMARRRQEIIRQLKDEGVFDLQRELRLPLFCQRIAVISSETAAGYGDFRSHLYDNAYGFSFTTRLFPAVMQGDGVEQSIIAALDSIYSDYSHCVDCVVIIRGGGATSDMSGFDTLALAETVANYPIPVITGIGHDRDECILDMVSHVRVKTPTAAADLLINHLVQVSDVVNRSQERIALLARQKLATLTARLKAVADVIPPLFSVVRTRQGARLDALASRLATLMRQKVTACATRVDTLEAAMPMLLERRLLTERHRLQLIEEKAAALDPALLLRRGYSITLKDGHALRDAEGINDGDVIETRLANGTISSKVIITSQHT